MRKSLSRGDRAVKWIESYCVVPGGLEKGQHVRLSSEQRATVRQIYDNPDGPQGAPVTGNLAAYLALLHVCGPEALQRDYRPEVSTDVFTVWGATGPGLCEVLKRDGDGVVCPELRTRYPVAA
jgi:hypothetical protein